MSACWMLVVLLGCRLARATQSENACACNVEVKTVCASANQSVAVDCQNTTSDVMMLRLLRGQEVIANVSCSREHGPLNCTQPHARVGIRVGDDESVRFILHGVNKRTLGVYRCASTIIFPPPLTHVPSSQGVRVAEQNCKCGSGSSSSSEPGDTPGPGYDWVWILAVILLSIYGVAATMVAVANWVKLRNVDSGSDYMNTKPRAPKDRKKKRGVQNPIPRYL